MKIWFLIAILFFASSAFSQNNSDYYTKEIRLVVDNDVFTSIIRDQYYSSGLFGFYRHIVSQSDSSAKIIRSYSLNQRIFTPNSVRWRNVERFDRPYAGHISVFLSNEYYRPSTYLLTRLELGWMGPGSLTGDIQETWHKWFGLPNPEGWDFQIQNSPIINYYMTFAGKLVETEGLDILSESNLSLGTAFTNIRQELIIRMGKFNTLGTSVHYNGQLGSVKKNQQTKGTIEGYLFYAPGVEYNFNNTTIEGNIIGTSSPHTEVPLRWIWQHKGGFMLSWPGFDIQFTFYWRSREASVATPHVYGGLHLNKRF